MKYRIKNPSGDEIGRTVHAEDAAALVAVQGDGARILVGRSVVFTEGEDGVYAAESYDRVADLVHRRETWGPS